MLFFSLRGNVDEPIVLKDTSGNPLTTLNVVKTEAETIDENSIYVGSYFDIKQLSYLIQQKHKDNISLQFFDTDVIENAFKTPIKVGGFVGKSGNEEHFPFESALSSIKESGKTEVRILYCNAFGNSYTDAFFSTNIHRVVTEKLIENQIVSKHQGAISVAFKQGLAVSANIHPMNFYMNSIFPLSMYLGFDMCFSLADLDMRNGYLSQPLEEFFFKNIGLEPCKINYGYHLDQVRKIQIKNHIDSISKKYSKITLIQTEGTYLIHTMPDVKSEELIEALIAEEPETLFLTDHKHMTNYPNLVNFGLFISDFADYLYVCECADSIISVFSLASFVGKITNKPTVVISTGMSTELISAESEVFSGFDIKEHEYSKPSMQLALITQEKQEEIWSNFNVKLIVEKYKALKEATPRALETFESGDRFLARANGIGISI